MEMEGSYTSRGEIAMRKGRPIAISICIAVAPYQGTQLTIDAANIQSSLLYLNPFIHLEKNRSRTARVASVVVAIASAEMRTFRTKVTWLSPITGPKKLRLS